jgi:hypothetical protein
MSGLGQVAEEGGLEGGDAVFTGLEIPENDTLENLAGKFETPEVVQKVEAKKRFFRQFLERIYESIDAESPINDVEVVCGDSRNVFRLPALLLGSILQKLRFGRIVFG